MLKHTQQLCQPYAQSGCMQAAHSRNIHRIAGQHAPLASHLVVKQSAVFCKLRKLPNLCRLQPAQPSAHAVPSL